MPPCRAAISGGVNRKPRRVLLIDDNPAVAEIVRALLTRNGYEVEVAVSADAALAVLGAGRIDVVVSDTSIAGQDAFALGQRIRSGADTSDIPIVYMAAGRLEDEFLGYLAGGDAWVAKPFKARELLDTLERVLDRRVRPSSSARLAVLRDCGRVMAAVSGVRARLVLTACRTALCELEVANSLEQALVRADREKFDLLVCESQPVADVQQQVGEFLDRFGLALPVLFLLEHTQPLPDRARNRWAVSLPVAADELAGLMQQILRECKPL